MLASHPLWLAPLLSRHLTATSGRAVHFDSVTIGLTSSLMPVAHFRGVRIDNAPWATDRAPFALLSDAVFVFDWRRFEDRHVVTYLLLRNGVVHLESAVDGHRNWRLSDPEDRGPGHYWFFSLEAHAVKLGFIHQGIDLVLNAAESDVAASTSASGEVLSSHIDVDGTLRSIAFRGSVATGAVLTFLETDRWFGLRGRAEIDGAGLDVDGRVADLFRSPQIDADASLFGHSLAALRPLLGERYGEPRAFRAGGHVRSGAGLYVLAGAHARVGETGLAGDLAWSTQGSRRAVRVHLKSESTRLVDLLWLVGRPSADIASGAMAAGPAAAPPPARDLFSRARDLDADVTFDAAHFHVAGLPALQSLKLKAGLAAARLVVTDLDIGWGGGHTIGTLGLDLRRPLAAAYASFDTRDVRAESVLAASEGTKRVTGILHGRLTLKASGNTVAALRDSVSGQGMMELRAGTISSLLDAEMGLEGGKLMRTMISGVDALPLPCAAAIFEVNGARARISDLVVDSANTRSAGSGTIDLRDGAIDLVLTPQPKRPGLFELNRSIRLFGRLPKPHRALVDPVEPPADSACVATHP